MKLDNIKSHCFEIHLHSIVLNLTIYVRNGISFFYEQKKRRNSGVFVLVWYVWTEETHSFAVEPNKHTAGVYFSSWLDVL